MFENNWTGVRFLTKGPNAFLRLFLCVFLQNQTKFINNEHLANYFKTHPVRQTLQNSDRRFAVFDVDRRGRRAG